MYVIRRLAIAGLVALGIAAAVVTTADHAMSNLTSASSASSASSVASTTDTPWE